MSDNDVAEILKLPAEERLRLVELIWESLSATPAQVPLSDAHRGAIEEELADHQSDPNDILTLEQVLAEVRRAR
ncbi:MAG: addiction module protein [Burkholderiales bacterium]|nr:addiction module protein [Burkholderiales bacterium]